VEAQGKEEAKILHDASVTMPSNIIFNKTSNWTNEKILTLLYEDGSWRGGMG
jgi:hypothetical protein